MAKKPQGRLAGRDSGTGQFVTVSDARRRPATTTVEHLPLPKKGK